MNIVINIEGILVGVFEDLWIEVWGILFFLSVKRIYFKVVSDNNFDNKNKRVYFLWLIIKVLSIGLKI